MSTIPPTKKQQQVLEFIEQYVAKNGYSPSYREIGQAVGLRGVATVALHVHGLIERGYLENRPGDARAITIVPKGNKEEVWLVSRINQIFKDAEAQDKLTSYHKERLQTMIDALDILGMHKQKSDFAVRLRDLTSGRG